MHTHNLYCASSSRQPHLLHFQLSFQGEELLVPGYRDGLQGFVLRISGHWGQWRIWGRQWEVTNIEEGCIKIIWSLNPYYVLQNARE